MKIKNKINNIKHKIKHAFALLLLAVSFLLNRIYIHADAGDKMNEVIDQAGTQTNSLLLNIGKWIAAASSAVCGLVALAIVIYAAWKTRRGAEGVWDDEAPKLIALTIIAVIAGLVAGVFFNV